MVLMNLGSWSRILGQLPTLLVDNPASLPPKSKSCFWDSELILIGKSPVLRPFFQEQLHSKGQSYATVSNYAPPFSIFILKLSSLNMWFSGQTLEMYGGLPSHPSHIHTGDEGLFSPAKKTPMKLFTRKQMCIPQQNKTFKMSFLLFAGCVLLVALSCNFACQLLTPSVSL